MVGFLPATAFFPPYLRSYYVGIIFDAGGHVPNAGSVPIILYCEYNIIFYTIMIVPVLSTTLNCFKEEGQSGSF